MKKEIIVSVEKPLTTKERRNFSKAKPGKRLCFGLRFPHFPLVISIIALLIALGRSIPWV